MATPMRSRAVLEDVEPRILYAADHPVAAVAATLLTPEAIATPAQAQPEASAPRDATELVFIDERVPDADMLIADITAQAAAGRHIEVVRIGADDDGIALISAALADRTDVGAVHLIAHGSAGSMALGRTTLDQGALMLRAGEIAAWGDHLTADADLLLYGCDVASTADGVTLVQNLAQLTGADVAASNNATGAAALGGDWVLEVTSGHIESALAIDAIGQRNFQQVLANTAPVLTPIAPALTPISVSQTNNAGQTIASIVGNSISDADVGAVQGIALTGGYNNGLGVWQYSLNGGTSWNAMPLLAINSGLLLRSVDLLRFVPNGSNGTPPSLVYRAWDQHTGTAGSLADPGSGGGSTAYSTATDNATLTLTAANSAPVLTPIAPTLTTITEDATTNAGQTVASFVGSSISDANSGAVQGIAITGLVSNTGTWQYSTDAGSSWTAAGTVSGTSALVLRSTDYLRFVPDAQNATTGSITYRAWDQTNGSYGSKVDASSTGGTTAFSTATDTASITVTAVNDAPVLTAVAPTLSPITEDQTANAGQTVASFLGASITDVDTAAVQGIAITGVIPGNGTWQYSINSGTTWTAMGAVSGTSALLLRSTDYVRFVPDGANGTTALFIYRAWDQTSGSAGSKVTTASNGGTTAFSASSDTATITVSAVNDAPVLTPAAPTLTGITEDQIANGGQTVASIIGSSITDVDTSAAQGIAITGLVSNTGTWQYSTDSGSTWTAIGTVSGSSALLLRSTDSVRFVPNGIDGTTGSITYRAWDQTNGAFGAKADASTTGGTTAFSLASDTASITVTAVNDAPSGTNKTVTTNEDTAYTFAVADFGFTDVDGNSLLAVKITTLPGVGSVTLNSVTITAGQVITAANITSGLLRFTPAANANGVAYAGFTFQVQDNGGTANGGVDTDPTARSMTVNVTAVNDAPSGANKTVTTNEDSAYTFTVSDFGFTDADGNSLLAVKIATLPGVGGLTLNGVAVTAGQTISVANVTAGNLKFTPAADANGTGYASFTFQVQDDGGTANGGIDTDPTARSMTVNVTAVNDAPSGANKTVTTLEDSAYTFIAADFGFTDTDGNSLLAVKTTTLPGAGSLTLNGVAVTASQSITLSNITSGLLKFTPAANANGAGYASFTFQVQDNGGITNGGVDTDPTARTLTVNVTAVNDAPSGANKTVTTLEDSAYTFTAADFGFSDADGNSLLAVQITALPSAGSLTLSGVAVTAGQAITAANITSGLLKFTPGANANGTGYASFTFQVQDDGGTANGGIDTDPTARTMTLDVTSVNDAPGGTDKTVTTLEDTVYAFSVADFGFTDVDGNSLLAVKITTLPVAGGLTLNGVAVSAGQAITAANITSGLLKFTPAANANGTGYASFTFQVQDDGGTTNGGVDADPTPRTMTIDVTAVNDAPVLTPVAPVLTTITEDQTTNPGQTVATLLGASVSDVDTGAAQGIAITATVVGNGNWQYSRNAGITWQAVGTVSDTSSLLLRSIDVLRFTPNGQNATSASVTYRAWDQTSGASGSKVSTTTNGGTTAFSTATDTATVSTSAVNDAPVLTPVAPTFAPITEDQVANAGQTVASVVGTSIADVDAGAVQGIAITGLSSGNGSWQYSIDAGTTWAAVGAVSGSSALALRAGDSIRFVPNGLNATTGSITYRAWDQTSGSSGTRFDTGVNGGTTAFSTASDTASISVSAVNDAPAGTSNTVTTTEDTAYVFTTADLGFSDLDGNALQAVRITALPSAGTLLLSGVAVTAGQAVAVADITAGNLRFTPAANANGAGYTSFTFQVQDNGGTANGGIDTDPTPRTMTVNVSAVNDAPTGAPAVTGTPTEDQTLTANTSAIVDADGLGSFSYQWLRGGAVITGATASTYTLGDADVGTLISVRVAYTDGGGTSETLTSVAVGPVANVNDAPTGLPTISGTPSRDSVLTAGTGGIADVDGLGAFSYQWLRGGVVISGATASTYTLVNADVGGQISVRVSYTDGYGTAESLTSAAVGPVAFSNQAPTGAPAISGIPTEDQTLTADTSAIADADGLGAFSSQWLRGGVLISGATASTYVLGDADVGMQISVRVSYTDGLGTAESITSSAVGPVANVNDAPTGLPAITGTPSRGSVMTAGTGGIADDDGLGTFSYQWLRGGAVISGATASTYTLVNADVGVQISVRISYSDGHGTAESLTSATVGPVTFTNQAPTGAPTVTGTPIEDQTLTADTSAIADADGLGALSYQWLRGGAVISGATASTYVLGDADVGAQISVQVNYTDGLGTTESITSAAVGPVVNINDTPTGLPTITGTPSRGNTLTANTGSIADADGLGAFSYQWLRSGVVISGATSSNYTLDNADVGGQISVDVSYTDGHGTAESLTSAAVGPVTFANQAPTGAPVVTGTLTEDQMLTANTSAIADADGLGAFGYQWLRGGAVISGATASTYVLGDADVGTQISVRVSYTDGLGTAESITSAAVGPVANVNDAPTGLPAITGTPSRGSTLTANTGAIADADGLGVFSYQWLRGGVVISGATASTYTLVNADVAGQISVLVSYTDGHGTAESLTSATVGPVTFTNQAPTGAPAITGTPTEDQTLTADTSAIADADGMGAFSYQWLRGGATITGATASTYVLSDADVGTQISVQVSYTDGLGTAESITSSAIGPVANVNDVPTGLPTVTGTPSRGNTLTANTGSIADADDLGAFSYQWLRGGTTIFGATSSTYALDNADVGQQISVRVSYTDGHGTAESLTSAPVGPVTFSNQAPTGAPAITGTPTEDQTLTADTSAIADADGLGAFSYQWLRGGAVISGATASTYVLGDTDVGTQISVRVSYTDGMGTNEQLISATVGPVANVNDAPTGLPVITGTPSRGSVLTAGTGGIADNDGLGAFSYQWLRGGVVISGATDSTYTLVNADVGGQISVTVSYTDGHGTAESLTSTTIGPVTFSNQSPTGAPSITGTPTEDQTLTANTSAIADADGLGAFSYQWLRGGAVISGATASSYVLGDADVGAQMSVRVSYTDGLGTAESITSAAIGPVANINDAPVLVPAAPTLSTITENDVNNGGQTVASFLGGSATDADAGASLGVAITAADAGNGAWQYSIDNGTTWQSMGAVGDGSALLLRAGDLVRFEPDTKNGTSASISYRAWDGSSGTAGNMVDASVHGGATAWSDNTDEATISVVGVNDPPTTNGIAINLAEGGSYVFTVATFNLTDPVDVPANAFKAVIFTSLATAGTVTLSGTAVTVGQSVSAADIAAGLLRYTPVAGGHGTAYATFTVQLQDDGGTANGGVDTDPGPRTATVNVAPVNDAPVITSNGGGAIAAVSMAENTSVVTTVSAFDPDGPTLTYSIGGGADANLFTIDGLTGVLSFITAPDFEAPSDADADNVYHVIVQASDGMLDATQAIAVTVTNVNDNAPVIAVSGGSASYIENAVPVAIDPGLLISDVDGGPLTRATVGIGMNYALGEDLLGFTGQNGITGSWNSATGTLTLTGTATVAQYEAALRSVTYVNTSQNPDTATRTVSFTVDDGVATSTAVTRNMQVVAVNDAPAGTDRTVTANEDNAYVFAAADFGFSDGDGNGLSGVRITTVPGHGTLALGGVAVTAGQVVGVADIDAGRLTFMPDADANGAAYAVFTFQVQDDGGTANGGGDIDPTPRTLTIDVAPLNDAPVVLASVGSVTYTPGGGAVVVDSGLRVWDMDSTHLVGASIAIAIGASDAAGQGVLGFVDQNGIAGQWNAAAGVLTLSGRATVADYQAALRSITYANGSGAPGTAARTVSFSVSDGSTASATVYRDVVPAVVNTAPVITSLGGGANASVAVPENAVAVATVTAVDAEAPPQTLTYSLAGGADAALFALDAQTGVLRFVHAPDAENPTDADHDNVYEVVVRVSDGSASATQAIKVTVTDVNEFDVSALADTDGGPNIVATRAVDGGPVGITVHATDADATAVVSYSLVDSASGRFTIDPVTGVVTVAHSALLAADRPGSPYGITVRAESSDGSAHTGSFTVWLPQEEPTPPVLGQTLPTLPPIAVVAVSAIPASGDAEATARMPAPEETRPTSTTSGEDALSGSNAFWMRITGSGPSPNAGIAGHAPLSARLASGLSERRAADLAQAEYLLEALSRLGSTPSSVRRTAEPSIELGSSKATTETPGGGPVIDAVWIGSTALSLGMAVWATRGGALLTSMLSTTPAWQNFDPVPVLRRAKPNLGLAGRKLGDGPDGIGKASETMDEQGAEMTEIDPAGGASHANREPSA